MASIQITLTAFLYQWIATGALDPCSDFWTLDQPWRSTSYTPGPNDPLQCDRFLDPGWYRFAGGGMPTTCPSSFSCGTQAPIWMNGQLPLPNEGVVNRSACAVITNAAGQLDCCGQEVLIQVRNCGDFVVYCLHNTPGCSMAYCSDVPGGTVPRQINTQPAAPVLVGPEVIDGGFRFSCNLSDTRPRSGVQEVTWTFDGVQAANAPVETLTGDNHVAYLDQRAWTGHVGSELRCRVRIRNDVTGQFGDFVNSNGYWGGIRVTPTSVTVTEGEGAQEVTLTSTLPIVCSHDNECELQLELDVNGTRWEDIAATESCVLHLRREDWDVSTHTASVTTRIVATRDVIRDGDQSLAVRFRPLFSLAPPLWHNYSPPEIQVRTVDRTVARCYGYADPHIQTFDRQGVYHLYEEGDFVLLRSLQNNFEIHVRTVACAGRSCICGVAVQRDYDAISLSVCEGQGVLPPEVRVLSDHGLQASTTVTRTPDGREYMLAFTTGEWVKITDFSSYMNVEVQVTGSEFGVTSGLCGTFDNNADNDFTSIDGVIHPDSDVPLSFTESWRLQPQDSLLNGVLRPVTEGFSRDNTELCTCNAASGSIDCGLTRGIMDPARDLHRDCHHCDITDDIIRWRENSAVGDDTEDIDLPIVLIDNGPVTPPPSLPPVTSRDVARRVCVSAMTNLTLTSHCATAVRVQMEAFVTSCVEDMMSAGSQQFLVSAVASWERACAGEVTSNPQSYPLDNRVDCNRHLC
ncbi:von Willebrand factor D and EGF domain-containing protein-like [Pomacea canaliculata]|uniref:von Willebrand factor D and EGF domain-containing protein-like n=1 Tax=Pomacea canaliculata TaxID=400727 RepID=UPI000D72B559|nr:von Willebrand factor D and EGF domain-containing protein-like [Pomacea canaliculata]